MLLKIKNFDFQQNYTRYKKKILDKIVHLKKIYKFISEYFLIGRVVWILIVKNVIKNDKFNFAPNLCEVRKKMLGKKIFRFKKIYKF